MATAQERFLAWAESSDNRWPEIKEGRYKTALLDKAIQEGVADFLKQQNITPLRDFLESSAKRVSTKCAEGVLLPGQAHKTLVPEQESKAKVLKELCELYGFLGDYDAAWKKCIENGNDSETSNYLVYGTRCVDRRFTARQGYYFSPLRIPLTASGRKIKAAIFPLVDEAFQQFETHSGKNLFDFYLEIAQAVFVECSTVPELESYKSPKGQDMFERDRFQKVILAEFQRRFEASLKPFEEHLISVFHDHTDFTKAKETAFVHFKIDLMYPLRSEKQFLYGHFCDVASRLEAGRKRSIIQQTFKDGQHQVLRPYFPALIQACMVRHIEKCFRSSENRYRQNLGLRGVGQGWVSEATLFAQLKANFPNEVVLQHAKPEWIGRQHLDIYFPHLNIAVEYQGVQHQRAVPIFGGEAGLLVRRQLDKKKKALCEANNCLLVEVFPDDVITQVVERIRAHANLNRPHVTGLA